MKRIHAISIHLLLISFFILFVALPQAYSQNAVFSGSNGTLPREVTLGTSVDFQVVRAVLTTKEYELFATSPDGADVGKITFKASYDGSKNQGEQVTGCSNESNHGGDYAFVNIFLKKPTCDATSNGFLLKGTINTSRLPASFEAQRYSIALYEKGTDNAIGTYSFTVPPVTDDRFFKKVTLSKSEAIYGKGESVSVVINGIDLRDNKSQTLWIGTVEGVSGNVGSGYYAIFFEPDGDKCKAEGLPSNDWANVSCALIGNEIYQFKGDLLIDKISDAGELIGEDGTRFIEFPITYSDLDYTETDRNKCFLVGGTTAIACSVRIKGDQIQAATFEVSIDGENTNSYDPNSKSYSPDDIISVVVSKDDGNKRYSYTFITNQSTVLTEGETQDCGSSSGTCNPIELTIPQTPDPRITLKVSLLNADGSDGQTILIPIPINVAAVSANACFICPTGFKPGGTRSLPTCSARAKILDPAGSETILKSLIVLNNQSPEGTYIGPDGTSVTAKMEIIDSCEGSQDCNPGYGCGGSPPPPPGPPCLEYSTDGGDTVQVFNKESPPEEAYICTKTDTALIAGFATDPGGFVRQLLGFLLSVSGGIALLLIMRSGYQMMTSTGNPEAVQEAKERITSAIVGLLFIIFSLVILQVIGVDILQIFPST